ncbi:MAG: hypothetical protein JNJ90_14730 [Saprospiraceae bacterium]|jgi:hypothetical protein|nr:hypothetical protein [Saprospiraceae bacterium]
MSDLSIQRQGEEVVIRLNVQNLSKALLDKIGELLFWEHALQKAGFTAEEIRQIFAASSKASRVKTRKAKPMSDHEMGIWVDDIERQWWEGNAGEMLKGVVR